MSEGERHLYIKRQISQALARHPDVTDLQQEHYLGKVQADLTFSLHELQGAVEIQRSHVSWMNIVERTQQYHRLGIHVLWVLVDDAPEQKRLPISVPMWQRCLHALYFGVVYYWTTEQQVLPLHLERCVNPKQQYYDFQRGRWHSPLYEHLRMPWLLEPVSITELHPVTRPAGIYGGYTLPEASLLNLPYEVLQEAREKSKKYLDFTRNHSFSWR
jgi:hypothetical protein